MDSERLDRWCERGILTAVLAILVFGPLATGAVRTLEFLVLQGLACVVLLLWGVRIWCNARLRLLWPPICWAVAGFVAYAIARYWTADIEHAARQELIRVLVYAFLFLAILNNLYRQETMRLIGLVLVFLGMGISMYAVYQFLSGSQSVWHFTTPYEKRAPGTYINPNHLAGYLEVVLPLALAYTLVGRFKPVTKVILGYASLAILTGIGVSISRGAWIATGVTLLAFIGVLMLQRNYRGRALVLFGIVIAAGFVFVAKADHTRERFQRLFVAGKVDDARVALWRPPIQIWRDHFWWGAGPAHFDHRFREYRPQEVQRQPNRAHNDYLNTLADWGLVGALLVGSAWVLLFVGVCRCWRHVQRTDDFKSSQSNRFALVFGGGMGLVAILIHSATDFNMHIPANAILVVTVMSLVTSHLRFATDGYWVGGGRFAKLAVTAVFLVGFAYLGFQGVKRFQEYRSLQQATKVERYSPEFISAMKQAHAVESMNFETTYAIGEAYRFQSWGRGGHYREQAEEAMGWFRRGMELNPYDGYNPMRYGMCLDWLGRHDEADAYFQRGNQLDPNGYFMMAHIGWHYVQKGQFAAAMQWFERSRRLEWKNNPTAYTYLDILDARLAEAAASGDGW